jgi:hypothetical protein
MDLEAHLTAIEEMQNQILKLLVNKGQGPRRQTAFNLSPAAAD